MIELLIAACLMTGECRDFSLLYDSREVSMMTCTTSGQAEVARWQAEVLKPYISSDLLASTTPVFFLDLAGRRQVGYDATMLPGVA